jgi:RNA polymerase sigma-70 factor (ECF subfamily)
MTELDLRDGAIDRAYRDHAPEVYRIAYGILRDPDDALEVTQETFARGWERWDRYDAQRPLIAWLHGIAVHLALDAVRRRRTRRVAVPQLRQPGGWAGGGQAGPDPADAFVQRQALETALDTMKPETRAALVLRHYYGYDYAGIAAMLGTAEGTVGPTLSRAHRTLRERLGPLLSGPEPDPASRPDTTVPHERTVDRPEVIR